MKRIEITAYELAERFIGIKETPGLMDTPLVLAMLRLDAAWPAHDEVPWCSAFANFICHLLRLPRSKSLSARSWLSVGHVTDLRDAQAGFDVVILSRGSNAPGPDVLDAPGHVGFYAGREGDRVYLLGGNQSDSVSVAPFASSRVLGVRRVEI